MASPVKSLAKKINVGATDEEIENIIRCPYCQCCATTIEEVQHSEGVVQRSYSCMHCNDCGKTWHYCPTCKKIIKGAGKRLRDHVRTHGKKKTRSDPMPESTGKRKSNSSLTIPVDASSVAMSSVTIAVDASSEAILTSPRPESTCNRMKDSCATAEHANKQKRQCNSSSNGRKLEACARMQNRKEHPLLLPLAHTEVQPWLESLFGDDPLANPLDLEEMLADSLTMKNYWVAEQTSREMGLEGGGVCHVVTRAFSHSPVMSGEDLARYPEATWHFLSFLQYQRMNEKQRKRQFTLIKSLTSNIFEKTTIPPNPRKIYGGGNQHAMYNTLPIPTVQRCDGIAYVNPKESLRFAFTINCHFDMMYVDLNRKAHYQKSPDGVISHVTHTRIVDEVMDEISRDLPENCLPCLVIWAVDWRDGFGTGHVKKLRNSVLAWTITFSPTTDKINSIHNTFPVAIGSKSNKAFRKVEEKFHEDMMSISDSKNPLTVYHGGLGKMVNVVVAPLLSMSDKPERSELTGTIGFSSNLHRMYGVILSVPSFECKTELLTEKLIEEDRLQNQLSWGWCDQFVVLEGNGAILPSCRHCRWKRLQKLSGGVMVLGPDEGECTGCCDWKIDQSSKAKLVWPAPPKYPKSRARGECLVEPPVERMIHGDQGENEREEAPMVPKDSTMLVSMVLSFSVLKAACKFAFWNCSQQQGKWTKAQGKDYLRSCGVLTSVQDELLNAAEKARKTKADIDYSDPKGLGEFRYPASWWGILDLKKHIELLMHILFLGVVKSVFELHQKWLLKKNKATGFRRRSDKLMRYLKSFQLSWLSTMPFGGKEHTTGAWVSENWLAFARVFQILNTSLLVPGGRLPGEQDASRVVASMIAMIARIMSHSGVNEHSIEEMEEWIKEFLSSIRELDVRLNFNKLGKKIPKKTGKGNKEASEKGNTSHTKTDSNKTHEAWWSKSNFLSLFNLPEAMRLFGPLILWWDGGGKGERYIQEIKPNIPKGVREDAGLFFVRLMQRCYKIICMDYLEKKFPLTEGTQMDDDGITNENVDVDCNLQSSSQRTSLYVDSDGNIRVVEEDEMLPDEYSDQDQAWDCCAVEEDLMAKTRAYYIYKSKALLEQALNKNVPLSGVVVNGKTADNLHTQDMYLLYRTPGKNSFGWKKVSFNDDEGESIGGLWFSELSATDAQAPAIEEKTVGTKDIPNFAKMSAVTVPLCYLSEEPNMDVPDALPQKHCVITNTWRQRSRSGAYELPGVAAELYK